jgi:hypothetical protein
MKRIIPMFFAICVLALTSFAGPTYSATKTCCPAECTCCAGGTCTCADDQCSCCDKGKCKPKKCEKACCKEDSATKK